jgi:hypothetical protein
MLASWGVGQRPEVRGVEVRLTRRGRRTWKTGLDGLSPGATLALEIMARVKHAQLENVSDMMAELIARYGSPEDAIVAIKSGKVGFEKST